MAGRIDINRCERFLLSRSLERAEQMRNNNVICHACSHSFNTSANSDFSSLFCPVCGARLSRQNIHAIRAISSREPSMNIQPAKVNNSLKKSIVLVVVSIIALFGIYVVIDACCDRKETRLEMEEISEQRYERKDMFEHAGLFSDGDVSKSTLSDFNTEYKNGNNGDLNGAEEDDAMIVSDFEAACNDLVIDAHRQYRYFLLSKKSPRQTSAEAWNRIRNEASNSLEKCNKAVRLNASNSQELRSAIKLLQEIIQFVNDISRPIGRATPKYACRTVNQRHNYELL